jgi:hypothetical protein
VQVRCLNRKVESVLTSERLHEKRLLCCFLSEVSRKINGKIFYRMLSDLERISDVHIHTSVSRHLVVIFLIGRKALLTVFNKDMSAHPRITYASFQADGRS